MDLVPNILRRLYYNILAVPHFIYSIETWTTSYLVKKKGEIFVETCTTHMGLYNNNIHV